MAFLVNNRITQKSVLKGSEKSSFKKNLRKDKKSSKKDCKKLKGKSKRDCKKGVRKNYRVSVKNAVRGGKSVLNNVVTKIGHGIKDIGTNFLSTALTGGITSGLTGGKFFEGIKATKLSVGGKTSPFTSFLGNKKESPLSTTGGINDALRGVLDLFGGGSSSDKSTNNRNNQSNNNNKGMDSFKEKLSQVWGWVRTNWYLPAGAIAMAICVWAYKKFGNKKIKL